MNQNAQKRKIEEGKTKRGNAKFDIILPIWQQFHFNVMI